MSDETTTAAASGATDAPTAPDVAVSKRPARWRRIAASILVVVGALLLLLSSFGWWTNRYFLNSERFSEKANKIIEQESVQNALAVAVTDQISHASGRDLRIAQPFITTIVREVISSDAFHSVFDAAVLRAHRAVVGGGARGVVLNMSDTVDQVKSALETVAPNLADEIPSGKQVSVRILDKTQLQTVYDTTNLIKDLTIALTVAALVFLAGGVALSTRRWRTLALAGWVTLGLFAVSLVAVLTGRPVVGSFIDRAEYSAAAQSAYKVITHGLVVQAITIGILGLLVALGAGWLDRHGGWAAARAAFARGTTWAKTQMPKKAAPAAPSAAAVERSTPAAEVPSVAIQGVLATRLPEPPRRARTAHWWRAAGLLVLGLFAVFSPGSLTTVVVVLLGLVALYLAVTEAVAAWASPKEPRVHDDTPTESVTTGA